MDQEVDSAIEELKAQGIAVAPSGIDGEVFIATVPDGEKYELTAAKLHNLKAEGRLHLEGLQEAHLAKKNTPNLS